MKRFMAAFTFVVVGALLAGSSSPAQDKEEKQKEKTLKGKITCGKCELKLKGVTGCATVFVTKKDKKDVIYFFDEASHKKYHEDVCTEGKKGTVTGVFTKEGKKNIVRVKSLTYE